MATGKSKKIVSLEIKKYIAALKKNMINVKAVYLFGSYARNQADEWSDIDLAVLTDKFQGDSFDFRFLLTKIARNIDSDIEPHPYLAKEFNYSNPFAAQILKHGEKVF